MGDLNDRWVKDDHLPPLFQVQTTGELNSVETKNRPFRIAEERNLIYPVD